MPSAKLTSKGQVTLPKAIREQLGVRSGDRIAFRVRENGTVTVEAEKIDIRSLRGFVKSPVRGITIEMMNEAIRQAGAGE